MSVEGENGLKKRFYIFKNGFRRCGELLACREERQVEGLLLYNEPMNKEQSKENKDWGSYGS